MTLHAVNVSVGAALTSGRYAVSTKSTKLPGVNTATTLADITTALGNAGGSFDSTTDITTIQTDVNALATAMEGDVSVIWDGTTITKRNQLRNALEAAIKMVDAGYGKLAE